MDTEPRGPRFRSTRLSFTEQPTRVWEIGEPLPFEIPEPCHEPDVPEPEPAHR
jgi:hypothetical protein